MSTEDIATYRRRIEAIDEERAELEDARNRLIHAMHRDGTTIAELSRATGLTRTMLYKILAK